MNDIQKNIITLGIVIGLLFPIMVFFAPAQPVVENTKIDELVAVALINSLNDRPEASLGAVSGPSHYQTESFLQGLAAGARDQFSVSNVGALTTSGAMTASGAVTLSSTLDVTGATTLDELTQGGSILSTSTISTAMVFIASDLLTYSTWEVTPNVADLTYTFPASSTLSAIIPSAGDSRTWTIVNATTTAAIDVIFAAGTGSAIKGVGGGSLTLDEDSHGTMTLTRKANSDIVITTYFPTAD